MLRLIKFIFKLLVIIILVGGLALAYARYIEPFQLHMKNVEITSSYVSQTADGLVIATFADTHFGEFYSAEDFSKVLKEIQEMKPDLVFFLGDLIDHYDEYANTESVSQISQLLSQIEAPYGKYAVFGNHDYGGGAEHIYETIMEAGGFRVLVNESLVMEELGIQLIGIDDVLIGYGDPSCAIAADVRPELLNIVLCHEPDVADLILDYDVDLMLSGHTHGRQVNLGLFDDYILPPYGTRYVKGLFPFENGRNTQLYVTSGIGMTKLPYRFASPPELTQVILNSKN